MGNLPHLLLYGPPGTGKTSTVLALARDLFGPSLFRSRVLELNASDERGIRVVREKVKGFSRLMASEKADGYPCPPFKIVLLDEADSMTEDAQSALRRVIEANAEVTRFCIVCNYPSRYASRAACLFVGYSTQLAPAVQSFALSRSQRTRRCAGSLLSARQRGFTWLLR